MKKPKPRTQTKTQRMKQQQPAQKPTPGETGPENSREEMDPPQNGTLDCSPPELPRSMGKELFASKPKPLNPPLPETTYGAPQPDGRRAVEASMERTLEEIDGRGGQVDVGVQAPRGDYQKPPQGEAHKTLGDRAREAKGMTKPGPAVQPMSMDELARQHARSISNDLHATDGRGRQVPTLADRVRAEGVRAQLAPKK